MNRRLLSASLAVLMFVWPVAALAQIEGASTYSDTVPKKSGAHHASGKTSHGHGTHKRSASNEHKAKSKTAKAPAAVQKTAAE
jgi:hypothetical protein